jgi:hypothetical protein
MANPYKHFLARCLASAANILCQEISANVYYTSERGN